MSAQQEAEKLTATWLNNLSIAVAVTGFITPASRVRETLANQEVSAIYVGSIALWLAAAYGVHLMGRTWLLTRYKE